MLKLTFQTLFLKLCVTLLVLFCSFEKNYVITSQNLLYKDTGIRTFKRLFFCFTNGIQMILQFILRSIDPFICAILVILPVLESSLSVIFRTPETSGEQKQEIVWQNNTPVSISHVFICLVQINYKLGHIMVSRLNSLEFVELIIVTYETSGNIFNVYLVMKGS